MAEMYLPLKHSHLLLVLISLSFFAVRGTAHLMNAHWQQQKWARIAPHIIDTFLMGTGIALMFATGLMPIEQDWLTAKMILLVGYIMFGIKFMRSQEVMKQRSYFAAAIICVLLMITVARTHHPLGMFSLF